MKKWISLIAVYRILKDCNERNASMQVNASKYVKNLKYCYIIHKIYMNNKSYKINGSFVNGKPCI